MKRRIFSQDFKLDAANLILKQGYTYKEAQEATGVSDGTLRNWVGQIQQERQGEIPAGARAITEEQQKVQALEKRIKQLEMEKEILKKATALLTTDSNQFSR